MDFVNYTIKDAETFTQFGPIMEDTGAVVDGSRVTFESDNSAAKMLAATLVEYDVMSPVMEGDTGQAPNPAAEQGNNTTTVNAKRKPVGQPRTRTKPADAAKAQKAKAGSVGDVVATERPAAEKNVSTKKVVKPIDDPNRKEILEQISAKLAELGIEGVKASPTQIRAVKYIDGEAKKAKEKWPEVYEKFASNPMGIGKLVFAVIQKTDPEFYEELKKSGKLNDKGENTASIAQKNEISKAISEIVGQIEVPDAFNVEIDDSDWENAVIKSYGFPMINLSSPLVREMLRAQEPKQQKRAYKEFKKQLNSDPDVAKALGLGIMGTLGIGGHDDGANTDKQTRIDARTESVSGNDTVLVEGPIDGIKDALGDIKNALKSPVDVLKSIARGKGTPCHRNNLVVMYDDIEGKSGESQEGVKVIPLGVSDGVLVDQNLSVTVPMSHLSAFYSVVDPKASFKSYAKAMAEVNTKSDNANKGLVDAAAAAGKKLLSKIPLLGRGAKKEMAAQETDGITKAMGELAMYIRGNGHPPFYLLKPKTEPKEIDKWSDEDAANGYQMITMLIDGRKAGMIMKRSTANALFKVG